MSQLTVKIAESNRGGKKSWSGLVSYPGLSGKLTKSDSTTAFSSESGVKAAAQRLAERMNTSVVFENKALKAAAKTKTSTKRTTKKKDAGSTPAPSTSAGCPFSC